MTGEARTIRPTPFPSIHTCRHIHIHTHTDGSLFAYAGTISDEADMVVTISREAHDNQTMTTIPYEVLNKTFNNLFFMMKK
jgi:hypothetical protein